MKKSFLLTLFVAITLAASAKAQVGVQVGDVKDTRTTGKFFAGLEIELKLFGDDLADAKAMRAVVKTAVDDTSRDLIDHEKEKKDFKEMSGRNSQNNIITLNLNNPARKAVTIKEVSGEVQLFVPKKDSDSTVMVESFQKTGGTPIVFDSLKAAGVEITAFNKEQLDAEKAKQPEGKKRRRKNGNMEEAFSNAFGAMFGMGGGGPNSITLKIKDPQEKLVSIEFQDANGKKIKDNGWSCNNGEEEMMKTFNFGSKMPEDARLVIYLATPKALFSSPFSLKDMILP